MSPIMDTKNKDNEQWGWFIDLESNEKIIIKNNIIQNEMIENKELERIELESKKQKINEELENKKMVKKKRYKFCIYNLILNLVCSVSIVFMIKFMIIL